jgi:hypothetical protein
MRTLLYTGFCGLLLAVGSARAGVIVRVAPPVEVVEERGVAPSPNHVWVGGYHRWDGNAYRWQAGRWAVPPRARAAWVAPRWERRGGGYYFHGGRWR